MPVAQGILEGGLLGPCSITVIMHTGSAPGRPLKLTFSRCGSAPCCPRLCHKTEDLIGDIMGFLF